jgi:hypothetical protein
MVAVAVAVAVALRVYGAVKTVTVTIVCEEDATGMPVFRVVEEQLEVE